MNHPGQDHIRQGITGIFKLMEQVKLLDSYKQENVMLEDYIRREAPFADELCILEAGCGQSWPLKLAGVRYSLTGADMDEHALKKRKIIYNDLDRIIIGDLATLSLDDEKYDVIYNSFVLEHLIDAERVLDNFRRWLKPGGILILRFPDKDSVYGFVTRMTPLWFHVWYKKYILGYSEAGKPGFGPYATYYNGPVSRTGIHEYCRKKHLEIKAEYGHDFYLNDHGAVTRMLIRCCSVFCLKRLSWRHNNLTYVIKKPPDPMAKLRVDERQSRFEPI